MLDSLQKTRSEILEGMTRCWFGTAQFVLLNQLRLIDSAIEFEKSVSRRKQEKSE